MGIIMSSVCVEYMKYGKQGYDVVLCIERRYM